MKFSNAFFLVLGCLIGQSVTAQYNRISNELEVSVFPSEGQSKATQERDENKCYDWAYDEAGFNDFSHRNKYRSTYEEDRAEKKEENRKLVNKTLGGAAAGTLIGALTGHTGKGLLIGTAGGAAVGAIGKSNQQKRYTDEKLEEERYDNDKLAKNFRACMDAKGYSTVK